LDSYWNLCTSEDKHDHGSIVHVPLEDRFASLIIANPHCFNNVHHKYLSIADFSGSRRAFESLYCFLGLSRSHDQLNFYFR
jgi:hypothetical protein